MFWAAFHALPKAARADVLVRLVADRTMRRDLIDAAILDERRSEPTRPLREYLAGRGRRPAR